MWCPEDKPRAGKQTVGEEKEDPEKNSLLYERRKENGHSKETGVEI